jgi:S-formylglutathione hydrolase FrmB
MMRSRSASRVILWRRRIVALLALVVVVFVAYRVVSVAIEPDQRGATVSHLTISSRAVGEDLPVTVVTPAAESGSRRRPLLVFLHGRGGDQNSELDDAFYAALAETGKRAPIVAFPYGGDASYWHDRSDGDWDRYVVGEVIPEVARRTGADPHRVAIGGISMGGFGAYDIAMHHPGRFCAVGGHSPAIWQSGGETAAGAFDDAEDFARNDVLAAAETQPAPFTTQPDWLDAGAGDPFQAGDQAFADALRAAGADVQVELRHPGGHDTDYWDAHWDDYLRFYAAALARC